MDYEYEKKEKLGVSEVIEKPYGSRLILLKGFRENEGINIITKLYIFKEKSKDGNVRYNLPGGKGDKGDIDALAILIRELGEEILKVFGEKKMEPDFMFFNSVVKSLGRVQTSKFSGGVQVEGEFVDHELFMAKFDHEIDANLESKFDNIEEGIRVTKAELESLIKNENVNEVLQKALVKLKTLGLR